MPATALRATRHALEVSTQTWEHDGRRIRLIGMVHLADPRFFAETARLLQILEADGAEVYAESVIPADGMIPTVRVLQTLARHDSTVDLVHQSIALPRQDSWQVVDMTLEQMLDAAHDRLALEKVVLGGSAVNDRRVTRMVGAVMRPALVPMVLVSSRIMPVMLGRNHEVVVETRNRLVMDAVLGSTSDAAVLWGAAHLPGMGRILAAAGYRRTDRAWRPAIAQRSPLAGIRDAVAASCDTRPWPWEGQELPETLPVAGALALARERGWLTDAVAA